MDRTSRGCNCSPGDGAGGFQVNRTYLGGRVGTVRGMVGTVRGFTHKEPSTQRAESGQNKRRCTTSVENYPQR